MVDVAFEKKRGDNMSAGGLAKRLLPLLVSIGTIFTLRSTTDSLSDVIVNDLGRSTQTSNFAPRDLGQSIRVSVTADAADDDFDAEPFGGIDESSSGDSEYVGGEDDIFSDYSKETEVAEKTSSLSEADDDNELADAEKQKTENEEELDNTKKVIEDEEKTEEEQSDVVDALEIDEQKEDADTKVKSEEDKSEEFMSKESNEIKAAKALIANNQHKEAFTPKEGDRFEPGSLPIPRSESIAQCYLKPKLKYFMAKSCAYSPDYKVILTMSGKTGSSTQRYVMNKVWNGTYTSCQELEKNGVEPGTAWVVATREPLDHFLSGYKEMLLRAKLWEEPMDYAYGHVPEEYNKFLDLVKHLDVKERASLKKSDKPEDLKLKSQMLETFIRDFDGKVFDEHLSMQAIQLRFNGKKMMNFNFTLESQHLSEELADLAKTVGAPIPPPVQKRSHAGEPLGEDLASDETIQKICQLRASDYCCLNYELPDICKKAGLSEKVECEWVKNPHNRRELSIKAVNMLDPDELSSRPDSDEANSDTAIESKQKEDENSEGKEGSKETSEKITPKLGDVFEPGSLPVSRNETIAQCYVLPGLKYFNAKSCAYSQQYKIMLTMAGKTGSSTQRAVMDEVWNGTYGKCNKFEREGLEPGTVKVVATREPLDHFLSGYKEMMLRAKLYEEVMDNVYGRVPEEYSKFLDLVKDMDVKSRAVLKTSDKPEDLKIKAKMLEMFVRDFDGENNFDEHLTLQALKLRANSKRMRHFDYVLESETLTQDLEKLASITGAPKPPPVRKRAHSGEPLGEDYVSDETFQKICKLRASDYCCLNYELPEQCRKAGMPKGEKVQCKWVENQDGNPSIAPDFV